MQVLSREARGLADRWNKEPDVPTASARPAVAARPVTTPERFRELLGMLPPIEDARVVLPAAAGSAKDLIAIEPAAVSAPIIDSSSTAVEPPVTFFPSGAQLPEILDVDAFLASLSPSGARLNSDDRVDGPADVGVPADADVPADVGAPADVAQASDKDRVMTGIDVRVPEEAFPDSRRQSVREHSQWTSCHGGRRPSPYLDPPRRAGERRSSDQRGQPRDMEGRRDERRGDRSRSPDRRRRRR